MPWLEHRPNGRYHVVFRFGGQKLKKSLRTSDLRTAEARHQRFRAIWQKSHTGVPHPVWDIKVSSDINVEYHKARPSCHDPMRTAGSTGQVSFTETTIWQN